jgi:UDP-N-acetylmuramate--alanine ligase
MEGITSEWLLGKVDHKNEVNLKEDVISGVLESDAQIVVTIGAGDIGELVESIKKLNESI